MKIDLQLAEDVCDSAQFWAESDDAVQLEPAYSGRGMGGDTTVGFVLENDPISFFALGAALVENDVPRQDWPGHRDGMGRTRVIVY